MFALKLKTHWRMLAALLIVAAVALSVRVTYLENSETDNPIRADAREYFSTAYNWTTYGVYSADQYKPAAMQPAQRAIRPPAYPAYLIPFLSSATSADEFVDNVRFSQALLSTLSVVLTFVLARVIGLNVLLSFFSALFMALCPHLIALDGYVLAESLFVFFFLASLLVLFKGWMRQNYWLVFIAGVLIGMTTITRTVALGLCPFLVLLFLIDPVKRARATLPKAVFFAAVGLFGFVSVYGPYVGYKSYLKSQGIALKGQSSWAHFVRGADVDLDHFMLTKANPRAKQEYNSMVDDPAYGVSVLLSRFKEEPLDHLRWFAYGKLLYMWKWDSTYVGDIYQYPMVKKGFTESKPLRFVYATMRLVHWPLYALTLASPLALFLLWRKKLHTPHLAVWVPMLAFAYFAILMTLLLPLPRYVLPLRPVSYVLAMWTIAAAVSLVKNRRATEEVAPS